MAPPITTPKSKYKISIKSINNITTPFYILFYCTINIIDTQLPEC